MKLNYSEGTWFAVPLRSGGFGVGVVARATSRGRVILVYLFGPQWETVPTLFEVARLEPSAAVLVARIGDLNLFNGKWTIIGHSSKWQRENWPIPLFVRSEELSRSAFIVRYDDKDPNRPISEIPTAYGTSTLDEDILLSAASVEFRLSKLLSSQNRPGDGVSSDRDSDGASGRRIQATAGTASLRSSSPDIGSSTPASEWPAAKDNTRDRSEDMTSWQVAIFTGDDAADWLGELTKPEQVREALAAVVEAPKEESLDVRFCGAALAAAEIVAAYCGRPVKNLPENAVEWVRAHPGLGKKRLVALAAKAVRRVETRSEMQALFDESELKEAWHGVIKDLLNRLTSAPV